MSFKTQDIPCSEQGDLRIDPLRYVNTPHGRCYAQCQSTKKCCVNVAISEWTASPNREIQIWFDRACKMLEIPAEPKLLTSISNVLNTIIKDRSSKQVCRYCKMHNICIRQKIMKVLWHPKVLHVAENPKYVYLIFSNKLEIRYYFFNNIFNIYNYSILH